ncbi:hypothetical protein Gotur_009561 [Gossypium turneri]
MPYQQSVSGLMYFLATGGIVRNHNGEWIIGYNRLLGSCSVFDAGLWDILDGLGILIDGGYDHVRIQADSLEAAKGTIRRLIAWSSWHMGEAMKYEFMKYPH